jgi:CDP-diacylglycerol--glycerol-3-phosphate 3-phosphatidyltransferase
MSGLYAIKPWFVRRLRRIEDVFVERGVSPDRISLAAVGVSALCGLVLALGGALGEPRLWLLVPPLGLARLALNALDGSVARRLESCRPFGEVVNEMGDRAADAAMLASLAFVVPPALALGALSASLCASVAGLLGSATGGDKLSGGPMGKADRVAVIIGSSAVAAALGTSAAFVVGLSVILFGALVTAALRVRLLHRSLGGAG